MINIKVGQGYDVHRLEQGREFWLGGIQIAHTHGAVGHSDADVLIHVICDALLGAASLRDIGFHFPDTDAKYEKIDSKILLKEVVDLIGKSEYKIGNVDATLCLQSPKISKYVPDMIECLAEVMEVEADCVSIKATTTENLGFVGREEGVSAHAIVLIYRV